MATDLRTAKRFTAAEITLRVVAVGLTVTMASVHLVLWRNGVRHASTVGPLFLLDVVSGYVIAAAVLATPRRWLAWTAALTALLNAGTLLALLVAIQWGLFGFHASMRAPHIPLALGSESGALLAAVILTGMALSGRRPSTAGMRPAVRQQGVPAR